MQLKDIKPNNKKRSKRVRIGRGKGTGIGKTSGKGHKGQKARSGGKKSPWFEGGQQRFTQRVPKSGFNNIFREEYSVINVSALDKFFEAGAEIDKKIMFDRGILSNKRAKVKILGNGEITKAFKIKADKFSKSAEEKIKKAGGEVIV
ncbi:MAG TPA: 50S ribosomal protein L15 [Firmicutes bacterium]|nr:50S ribosomal protein L15 [Bacillota bacterium]